MPRSWQFSLFPSVFSEWPTFWLLPVLFSSCILWIRFKKTYPYEITWTLFVIYHTSLISINEMLEWELFNRKFWCFLHHSTQVYMFIHVKQTYCWSRCFSIFSWCLLDSRSVNTFWVSSSSERVFSFSYIIIKQFQEMVNVLSKKNTNSTDNMNNGTTCTYVY